MLILLALFQCSGWIGQIDPHMTYPRDFEVDWITHSMFGLRVVVK